MVTVEGLFNINNFFQQKKIIKTLEPKQKQKQKPETWFFCHNPNCIEHSPLNYWVCHDCGCIKIRWEYRQRHWRSFDHLINATITIYQGRKSFFYNPTDVQKIKLKRYFKENREKLLEKKYAFNT